MKKVALIVIGVIALIVLSSGCSKKEYNMFGTLYGVVSDHETGALIANASIVLSPGGKTKVTGTDGRYEFPDLDAQQYTVTVQKTGFQTNRKTVTVVANEKIEANVPLTKSN